MADTVYPIKTMIAMGVEEIILTSSVGALNTSYRAGDIMFVEDQLNFMGDKDRKSTRLNSSHTVISYAVFCLKKKK